MIFRSKAFFPLIVLFNGLMICFSSSSISPVLSAKLKVEVLTDNKDFIRTEPKAITLSQIIETPISDINDMNKYDGQCCPTPGEFL